MSKLYRSRRDKKLTGLCGGLAETFNIDATLLRLLVVVTTFFSGGTVIFLYIVAAIVIPKEPGYEPPYDPYATNHKSAYNNGSNGWNPNSKNYSDRGPSYGPGPSAPYSGNGSSYEAPKSSNIDELMKDIEKKALQKELEELRAKVAQFEKVNNTNNKGDV
ncbi:DNA-binding transcriptional activator PspC [compost metagenome]